VSDEKSGDAVSLRRIIEVGVRREWDVWDDGGSSRPISLAYSTKVVASCANESLNGRAPSWPAHLSRSIKRRISERHSEVKFRTERSRASDSVYVRVA
jgi:hypothetical protein